MNRKRRPRSSSVIELSRSALEANLRFLQREIGGSRLISVVKSNAYGHGTRVYAPLARELGVNLFGVFAADEARLLLDSGIPGREIIIMGFIGDEDVPWAAGQEIAFYVSDTGRLDAAVAAGTPDRPSRIHLELETGLNRTGVPADSLDHIGGLLAKHRDRIRLAGICTHLAGAESTANHMRIQRQTARFHEMENYLRMTGIDPGLRHAASSAAALMLPETRLDAARIGIAQYGFWPSMETRMHYMLAGGSRPDCFKDPLKRVITWRSSIMGITPVDPGEFVGYGNYFLTSRRQRVAAVPVGYAQGFSRSLSNVGHVLVAGRRAPVCGLVNMNEMMVDITDCPEAVRGDEVVIIGRQGRREISVRSFGDLAGHLNYEVLAQLPESIPRRVTA